VEISRTLSTALTATDLLACGTWQESRKGEVVHDDPHSWNDALEFVTSSPGELYVSQVSPVPPLPSLLDLTSSYFEILL